MTDLRFAEPQWIHLLWAVLAFIVVLIWLERRGGGALRQFVSPALQSLLVRSPGLTRRVLRVVFLGLATAFLTLALMRPQWGMQFVATPRVGSEIMICLDVSKSMLAEDVAPNRLERAKADIRDLLSYLEGDQVGLIAFAGRATVLSPMTPDFSFLRLVLDEAGPHSVTRGGTRLEEPLLKAVAGFGEAGDMSRTILLITDGEDHDSFPLEAAKEAAERGIKILAIGIGDEAGSEIMFTDPITGVRALVRDGDGRAVRTRLDGEVLREIALITDGAYVPAGTGVLDLESIYHRHIVSLTRGQLDGRGRTVRNEAFQWAILLALLSLIAAVLSTAHGAENRTSYAFLCAAGLIGALAGAQPASAQDEQDAAAPESQQQAPVTTQKESPPEDPREAYNLGLQKLDASELDQAEKLFQAARSKAGTDGEARFRATYNLGWVEVKRSDAALVTAPEKALESLHRAADWFRAAISLRSGAEDARRNLEIVLRRAMELADSLAKRDEKDLLTRVNEVIEEQRQFLGDLSTGLDLGAAREDPNAAELARRAFRGFAARQLEILSQSQILSENAGEELASLLDKEEKDRTPEESVRAAQLQQLLSHLHKARERMGQARSQMRRLQAERSFRRAAAGLDSLKRARDQLLDPVTRLDALLSDESEIARLTALMAAVEGRIGTAQEQQAPAWLTNRYLSESQGSIEQRTQELRQGLAAGLVQADSGEMPQQLDEEQTRLLSRIREAEPLIGEAHSHLQQTVNHLENGQVRDALKPQQQALTQLAAARELFLDLRRLIELLYQDEQRIQAFLQPEDEEAEQQIDEFLPVAYQFQSKNNERASRVTNMIAEALAQAIDAEQDAIGEMPQNTMPQQPAPDPKDLQAERQRMEMADELQLRMQQAMQAALDTLDAAQSRGDADATDESAETDTNTSKQPGPDIEQARSAVDAAVRSIEDLRRLFFSVVEHLQELARNQVELGDETEKVKTLAQTAAPAQTAASLGPLAPRQRELGETAGTIAEALRQQASSVTTETAAPDEELEQAAQHAAEQAERLEKAAGHVDTAKENMSSAAAGMDEPTPALDNTRQSQDNAVQELLEAIALLQPPEQQQQPQGQQQEQEQQQGEQPEQNQEQDMSQLLQGIRDREAARREQQKVENGLRSRYEPVDKDW